MKYYMYPRFKFDYGELEEYDISVYETPDDFYFDTNLIVKFLQSKGLDARKDKKYGWMARIYSDKNKPLQGEYTLDWMMEKDTECKRDGIKKGEFLQWLETQGVKELKCEEIGRAIR